MTEKTDTPTHAIQRILERAMKQIFIVQPSALDARTFGCAVVCVSGVVLRLTLTHRVAGELAAELARLEVLDGAEPLPWCVIGRGRWTADARLHKDVVLADDEVEALEEAVDAMIELRARWRNVHPGDVLQAIEAAPGGA